MSAAKATASAYAVDEKRRAHEPSMEEILASIRRIISDDQNARFDDALSRPEPAYDDEITSEAADPHAYDQSAAEDVQPDPVEERRDNILRQLKASSEAQSRGAFRQAAEILETAEFDLPPIAPHVAPIAAPPVLPPVATRPAMPPVARPPEMEPASPLVNAVLTLVGRVEAALLRAVDLPWGTALIALALPAYEMVLKAAHTFNLLDARGAISVTERAAYIGRIRNLARSVSQSYFDSRLAQDFPMCPPEQLQRLGIDLAAVGQHDAIRRQRRGAGIGERLVDELRLALEVGTKGAQLCAGGARRRRQGHAVRRRHEAVVAAPDQEGRTGEGGHRRPQIALNRSFRLPRRAGGLAPTAPRAPRRRALDRSPSGRVPP